MIRTALVHDNFAQMGGAERVAEVLGGLLPGADIFTTLAVRERLSVGLRAATIQTTWMQRLPALQRLYRHYFLLYPFAIESIDLRQYDLIVTSCFGYAKGVRTRPGALHICYCHNPMRWVWRYDDYAARERFNSFNRVILPRLLSRLKQWDIRAGQRPDFFIANSELVAGRIRRFYGRECIVIPPPIDTSRFRLISRDEDHYLVLSRLVPYKRIDLAIQACNRLGRRLIVIGDGPDRRRLESLAGPTVTFMGRQPDDIVEEYAGTCRALLFPGEEDFGLAPLELNAAGRPVICYRGGGTLETVIEGVTGVFFNEPEVLSMSSAILDFELASWNRDAMRRHAEKFDVSVFARRFTSFVSSLAPGFENPSSLPVDGGCPSVALGTGESR